MSRNVFKPKSLGGFVGLFAVVAVVVLAIGAALNWPAVSRAHDGLARVYGGRKAHITEIKVINFGWACGAYVLPPDPTRWEFVESKSGFAAQEKSAAWLGAGGDRRWGDCMHYSRRGHNNRNSNAVEDWVTSRLAGVLG